MYVMSKCHEAKVDRSYIAWLTYGLFLIYCKEMATRIKNLLMWILPFQFQFYQLLLPMVPFQWEFYIHMYIRTYIRYNSTQTWHLFLITHECSQILFESLVINCMFLASNSCHEFNSQVVKTDYFMNLDANLFMSSAKEIQALVSIAGTCDFLLIQSWI